MASMISLKAFSETIAPRLRSTPAALYERQRALIRLGLLPPPVQGRGKGLPATPETVAMLVVAVMATDNLSDTDIRVRKMAQARHRDVKDEDKWQDEPWEGLGRIGGRCKLTGKVCFVDALAAILGSERLAAQVHMIRAFRETSPSVIIRFWPDGQVPADGAFEGSRFGRGDFYPDHMLVETTLSGFVVKRIEAELRKAQNAGVES
jgi:hypothetical protein